MTTTSFNSVHAGPQAYRQFKAILLPACALACLVMPIEFLSALDGVLHYRNGQEVLKMLAYGWLAYLSIGLVASLPLASAWTLGALVKRAWLQRASSSVGVYLLIVWTGYTFIESTLAWVRAVHMVDISLDLRSRVAVLLVLAVLASPILLQIKALSYWLDKLSFVTTLSLVLLPVCGVYMAIDLGNHHLDPAQTNIAGGAPRSKGPPIILISIDTLTARHMTVYGYKQDTTPNLAELAKESTVFDRFYANSNFTTPTINSLINGVRPWTHRVMHVGGNSSLDQQVAANGIAAQLKKGGYQTYAVATNIWAAPNQNGSEAWFDKVLYGRANIARVRASGLLAHKPLLTPLLGFNTFNSVTSVVNRAMQLFGGWSGNRHHDPSLAFDAAKGFLEEARAKDKPVFLWVHLLPPHDPYAAPSPFLGHFDKQRGHDTQRNSSPAYGFAAGKDPQFPQDYVGRYDESILYVDHHVGEFISWLKDKGLFDKAMVIITADHGESFGHGYGGHTGVALYEDLIHIPLIIKLPEQREAQRVFTPSEQVDVAPTILEVAGLQQPTTLEGRSRLKEAQGASGQSTPIFTMNFERANRFGRLGVGTVAMIDGRWKYVSYMGYRPSDIPGLRDSLFDIEQDPDEQHDRSQDEPQRASQMKAAIEAQLALRGGPIH